MMREYQVRICERLGVKFPKRGRGGGGVIENGVKRRAFRRKLVPDIPGNGP